MGPNRFVAAFVLAAGCSGASSATWDSGSPVDATGGATTTSGGSGGGTATTSGSGGGSTGGSGTAASSGSATSGGTGAISDAQAADPKRACEDYIRAFCERATQCQNLDPSATAQCNEIASLCPDYFFSPGSSHTPAQTEACAADVLAQPCDAFNSGAYLPCQTPGARLPGDPCSYSSQCSTLSCNVSAAGGCGSCRADVGQNGDCAPGKGPCPLSQVCSSVGTFHCVDPSSVAHGPEQGAACGGGGLLCALPFVCFVGAADAQAGTCELPPPEGAACTQVILANGQHVCSPSKTCLRTGAGQCMARVPDGQACDVAPNGDPCVIGDYCDIGDASTSSGVCRANRPAGQPCAIERVAGGALTMGGCISGVCAGGVCAASPPPPIGIGAPCGGDGGACGFGLECVHSVVPFCRTSNCAGASSDAGAD
jgi:hypothetical protein